MTESISLLIAAAAVATLIPLMPKVLCLRIAVLRVLRFEGMAGWHQDHFRFFVRLLRVLVSGLVILLVYLAYTGW